MDNKLLITLFNRVRVPSLPLGVYVSTPDNYVAALNSEIAAFGYTFDRGILEVLGMLPQRDFDTFRPQLHTLLSEVKGGGVSHKPLFAKFPYETPDQHDYLQRRLYGLLQNEERHNIANPLMLSCGHILDKSVFDPSDFNACPICQFQVPELDNPEEVRDAFKSVTKLVVLSEADDQFIRAAASRLLARNSSLSKTEREFLRQAADEYELTVPEKVFNENLPYVYGLVDDVTPFLKGATDIMRIAAFLSNPEADLSLADNTKFKLSTKDKKKLLGLLNSLSNLEEDMMRNRERWLRLGFLLSPGSEKNRKRYPRVAAAFDTLRNDSKNIETFSRVVENRIRSRMVDDVMLDKLAERPGEFLRRLDFLLREAGDTAPVLEKLERVAKNARTKMLVEISKYFDYRGSGAKGQRMFIPKGSVNKMQLVNDKRKPIATEDALRVIEIIENEVVTRFAAKDALGKVYLDENLKGLVLPYNKRGDSATSTAVAKGSRYPISPDAKVLRMFCWWKGNIDVDLSVNLFDENFEATEAVWYGNTQSGNIVHSGDIQDSPKGASEFIDFDVKDVRGRGYRYVAVTVISYRGEPFNTFPCFAGFMERDKIKSGARYEEASVPLKFDINTEKTGHMPLVFDTLTGEIIFVDIATGGRRFANTTHGDKFKALCRAAVSMPLQKPTAYDVLRLKALASGELVDTAEEADVVYSRDTVDLEQVAAELAD